MIRETAEFLAKTSPEHRDFLLLATEGVYTTGVYKNVFEDYSLNTIEPDDADKQTVMDWIYKIKAGRYDINPTEYEAIIKKYLIHEKTPVILGCTELPLLAERMSAPVVYVDPASILAKRCVEMAESSRGNCAMECSK
jgi:aspartate racemase